MIRSSLATLGLVALVVSCAKSSGPAPQLLSVSPSRVIVGDTGTYLDLFGSNLGSVQKVLIGGVEHEVLGGGPDALVVRASAQALAAAGDVEVVAIDVAGQRSAPLPLQVVQATLFRDVSVGGGHVCAVSLADDGYCLGLNVWGAVGDGTNLHRDVATPVVGGLKFKNIETDARNGCGLTTDGKTFCWGGNFAALPKRVASAPTFVHVGVGWGLTAEGHTYCWGERCGGDPGSQAQRITSLTNLTMLAPSSNVCGLAADAGAHCYGRDNSRGQLGSRTALEGADVRVGGTMLFSHVSTAHWHGCGISAGRAWCWGNNTVGELGAGNNADQTGPVEVSTNLNFTYVDAGWLITCAIATDKSAYCWGNNTSGTAGDGTRSTTILNPRTAPTTPVAGQLQFTRVSAGWRVDNATDDRVAACGITAEQHLYCWGYGFGALPVRIDPGFNKRVRRPT